MDSSFYTAAQGARTRQKQMDIIANNIANINTAGYREKDPVFRDLMYYQMRYTDNKEQKIPTGIGNVVQRTYDNQEQGNPYETSNKTDFTIMGSGFFSIQDPKTKEITYTRNGNFQITDRGDGFYLVTSTGKLVLNEQGNPIKMNEKKELDSKVGVYDFPITTGLLSIGDSEWKASDANGKPFLVKDANVLENYLEMSNVNLARQMTKVIESSRAYAYNLKMVHTADEVEQSINSLRS